LIFALCLLLPTSTPVTGEEVIMTDFSITSPAFEPGQPIPRRYTCEGADLSPALQWFGAPAETKSYALVCDDPDAPVGTWVHWVIYNLPASAAALPENVLKARTVPALGNARQGINDFRKIGYGGPCPPPGHGPHHYHFKLYALDRDLALEAGATKAEVERAMEDRILARTELVGTYER
jgi:Raf kinase inhibitor-like YbhB/YbcL family protein